MRDAEVFGHLAGGVEVFDGCGATSQKLRYGLLGGQGYLVLARKQITC